VTEQVSFAAAFGGKRKADAPGVQQGTKAQKSAQMITCTVCKVRKTNHASKICLSCATAAKKASARGSWKKMEATGPLRRGRAGRWRR
jgi:hypothetical protein